MKRLIKFAITVTSLFLFPTIAPAGPDQATQTVFQKLMAATVSNNYDAFIAECDPAMKAALTKPMLEEVRELIAPRAQQGYDAQYLGQMRKQGYQVHLWCLRFKDGGDDILATLSVNNGKAGGFYLK
jgi:hypothetical protein